MHDFTQQADDVRSENRQRPKPAQIEPSDHVARISELATKAANALRAALEHAEVQAGLDKKMIQHLEHQLREQEILIRELSQRIADLEGEYPWKG